MSSLYNPIIGLNKQWLEHRFWMEGRIYRPRHDFQGTHGFVYKLNIFMISITHKKTGEALWPTYSTEATRCHTTWNCVAIAVAIVFIIDDFMSQN